MHREIYYVAERLQAMFTEKELNHYTVVLLFEHCSSLQLYIVLLY